MTVPGSVYIARLLKQLFNDFQKKLGGGVRYVPVPRDHIGADGVAAGDALELPVIGMPGNGISRKGIIGHFPDMGNEITKA